MKFKTLIIVLVCSILLPSCNDEMNYKEHSNYDKEYIENHYKNVVGLIGDIYTKVDYDFGSYDGAMLASATDEAEYAWASNEIHDFYNGSWSAANPKSSLWNSSYAAIQACNLFLQEYLGLTFPELALNDDYQQKMFRYRNNENEARFLRAYFYFNLVRQYGDVPFFTHVITTQDANSLSRTSYQEIMDFIVSECDAIMDKIPADYTALGSNAVSGQAETGRVNRLGVLALKARTLLYAASPLFNTNNSQDLWGKAAQANKAVLDSCAKYNYTLAAYTDIWGTENYLSSEAIFVRRVNTSYNDIESRNYPVGVDGGNSGNCPTQTLVDAYQMKATGKFWNESGSGYNAANPYDGRDPRFEMSIVKNEDTGWPFYNNNPIQVYYGGLNGNPVSGATPTGYYLKKMLDPTIDLRASSTTKSRHSYITYRLSEFYLNYAEAVFNYTGSADAVYDNFMSAREAVNVIRSRPGVEMPALPTGLSNSDFWEQYTNEKMVEFAFEGHRFWDVRRWKEGEKFKSITRMNITRNNDGTYTYTRETQNRTWDDKMYFFPIPQSERMKNPNLTQNTGW